MSKSVSQTCPVCSEAFNDHLRLPLTTSCNHTTCATCLRSHTLESHPDAEPSREGQVPSGREIECQQCQKSVNTDELVIDRAVLAKLPLSLEDLIISDYPGTNDPDHPKPNDPEPLTTPEAAPEHPEDPGHAPDEDTEEATQPVVQQHSLTHHDPSQILAGWSLPPQQIAMDPNQHPQPPHTQPGGVGWVTSPTHPSHPHPSHPPHEMPHPPHGYPAHPPYHAPSHHPDHTPYPGHAPHAPHPHSSSHKPAVVAGAAGLAGGVAAGVGVSALSSAHKKKKKKSKDKKKDKKKSKEGKHRSSSSSSSSSSSGSGSGSNSS